VKALVTGAAGFIGSHLVDRLLRDGYSVTGIDNLSEGKSDNLTHLDGERRFHFVVGDLRDEDVVLNVMKDHEVVFHMAAHANIRTSLVDHKSDLEHNIVSMINLLDGMAKHQVRDMVFASTSALYGEATVTPTPEDYMPKQTSLYGASKLACEAYGQAFLQFAPIRFWSFRFSNVIGERCRRGVIWDFVHKLEQNGNELEILGDGNQSKEYLYVDDCIEGIITGYKNAPGNADVFNLGHYEQTRVDSLADIVIDEMHLTNVKKVHTGGRRGWVGDNPQVILSLAKIEALGWKPGFSSEDAIRRTVRWTLKHG
jgi:UDP-glucose 4-epimerase